LTKGLALDEDRPLSRPSKGATVPSIAFGLPVLPGQEDLDRQTLAEMEGPRREEYEAALKDAGITRQTIWHQQTPNGTLALVYMEADDEAGVARIGASDAPFNTWFRDEMKKVHGIDISESGPPISKVLDHSL
jgi:hypothetical protein